METVCTGSTGRALRVTCSLQPLPAALQISGAFGVTGNAKDSPPAGCGQSGFILGSFADCSLIPGRV